MDFYNAQKQFEENLQLFGNAQTQPERFNTYNGLRNLAIGLQHMQSELEEVKRLLVFLVNKR